MPPARKKKAPPAPRKANGNKRVQSPPPAFPPPPAPPPDLLPRLGELSALQRRFLAAYCQVGSVTRAALTEKVERTSHYLWMNDPAADAYREAFAEAKRVAADQLEAEARRRAYEGCRSYKFFNGIPILDPETGKPYYELNFSDMLMVKLLQAADPGRFREVREVKSDNTTRVTASVVAPPEPDGLDKLLGKLPLELRSRVLDALSPPPPDNTVSGPPG